MIYVLHIFENLCMYYSKPLNQKQMEHHKMWLYPDLQTSLLRYIGYTPGQSQSPLPARPTIYIKRKNYNDLVNLLVM